MTVSQFDVVEISARAEFNGVEDVINVYQFQLQTAAPVEDETAILQLSNHLDDIYTDLINSQTTDFIYRDLSFRNVTQNQVMGVTPWPTLVAGIGTGSANAPGIAGLINMATNVARVVLRKYFGGISIGNLDPDGSFTTALVNVLLTVAANLLQTFVTGSETWEYGYFSPKTQSFEIPVAGTVTDIPAYQRRRKQGRGS